MEAELPDYLKEATMEIVGHKYDEENGLQFRTKPIMKSFVFSTALVILFYIFEGSNLKECTTSVHGLVGPSSYRCRTRENSRGRWRLHSLEMLKQSQAQESQVNQKSGTLRNFLTRPRSS